MVYLKGLKQQGWEVLEVWDNSRGLLKYWRVFKQHWKIRHDYDLMFVGYQSNLMAPLARLISSKRVVYNALCSKYESIILDRQEHKPISLHSLYFWLIDWLAYKTAHLILVESEEQKKFLTKFFLANPKKFKVIFTGADEALFYPDPAIAKFEEFTVIFRGWFLPATGVEYVIEAAKLLEKEHIKFILIGHGAYIPKVKEKIATLQVTNLELITDYLSDDDLRAKMLASHICLGQFSEHIRLERTIQNKTFESLALALPYITRDSKSNREILTDGQNCLFVKAADPQDLADKIMILKNDPELTKKIARNGYQTFITKLSPEVLGKHLVKIIEDFFG